MIRGNTKTNENNTNERIEQAAIIILSHTQKLAEWKREARWVQQLEAEQRFQEAISVYNHGITTFVIKALGLVDCQLEIWNTLFAKAGRTTKTINARHRAKIEPLFNDALQLMGGTIWRKGYSMKGGETDEHTSSHLSIITINKNFWNTHFVESAKHAIQKASEHFQKDKEEAEAQGIDLNALDETRMLYTITNRIENVKTGETFEYNGYRSRHNLEHERIYNIFTMLPSEERIQILKELSGGQKIKRIDISNEVIQAITSFEPEKCAEIREAIKNNTFIEATPENRDKVKKSVISKHFMIYSQKEKITMKRKTACLYSILKDIYLRFGETALEGYFSGMNRDYNELFTLEKVMRDFNRDFPQTVHVHDEILIFEKDWNALVPELKSRLDAAGIIYKEETL